MPESEPMAFVQRMILQIRKHIPESGYLPTCSDRKPLKKYLGKSTDSESESDLQMILKVVALLMWLTPHDTTDHWLFDAIIVHPNP